MATVTLPAAPALVPPPPPDVMRAAVAADPDDQVAFAALVDALMESGKSRLAATRAANRALREALAAARLKGAAALVREDSRRGASLRTRIRSAAGLGGNTQAPVEVVAGSRPPTRSGEGACHTFKNGGACKFPGAARRAGYKTVYHPSTLLVTVGADDVLAIAREMGVSE